MTLILDAQQLKEIMPAAQEQNIEFYLDALNSQLAKFNINTPLQIAHFIAQIAHESGSFKYKVENLNYSAKALRAVFGKYFETNEIAENYARKPEQIANVVYANRMGNGPIDSGDGWKYRDRAQCNSSGPIFVNRID